ncbi:MAG: RagB/SusD family nutrient uptake outer membrane protein [Bacteroidales bacterium]|nr:RagB/SusD family nutrient uptake outer membrane protein [Bacteroidales bacterium]
MRKHIFALIALATMAFSHTACFNLDEETFSVIGASEYYQNDGNIQGAVSAIYYSAANRFMEYGFYLQEFSADQVAWRTWNGSSWGWDEGLKFVLSTHSWTSEATIIRQAWESSWETIGLCNNLLTDLYNINAEAVGLDQKVVNEYIAEVRSLRAWQYYNIFELWGGALPICDYGETDIPGSADKDFNTGCQKVYDFIMKDLDESVNDLSQNKVNAMNQAANRILKARLLLNSELFTGTPHYTECAKLCEEIINGSYGKYSLAADYRDIYGFNNASCPEVVFAFAQESSHYASNCLNIRSLPFLPYNYNEFLGYTTVMPGWNCICLTPSYDNSGKVQETGGSIGATCFLDAPYNDKLGAVYERFDNRDIRKAGYKWNSDENNYSGLFLIGAMKNLVTGKPVKADADRDGQDLVYVDQVGTFQNLGRNLETVMSPRWGETNSGIRMLRYPIAPESAGLKWEDIDEVEIRLTEAYYMLAECTLRGVSSSMGDAKTIVNLVRKRYFSAADWATAQNDPGHGFTAFDKDWMLSQWGIEFLCEGRRRRTDLRRFDKFTQGQWWFFGRATEDGYSLPAKRDRKYEWFPLPQAALSVNPGLVQNPNYNAQ